MSGNIVAPGTKLAAQINGASATNSRIKPAVKNNGALSDTYGENKYAIEMGGMVAIPAAVRRELNLGTPK